jgi:hypothetical protein
MTLHHLACIALFAIVGTFAVAAMLRTLDQSADRIAQVVGEMIGRRM